MGEFVALKRKGPRFLGLCPFHNEKTPSFNVSPNLGIYKCFGCGEAGDAITFLTKHEHLSYVEALRSFDRALEIDPHCMEAWANRANALQLAGRGPEAEEARERARALGYKGTFI